MKSGVSARSTKTLCYESRSEIFFRWVGTPINRTRQKVALVRRSIAMRGSVGKTASQAVNILRNEGGRQIGRASCRERV